MARWYFVESYATKDIAVAAAQNLREMKAFGENTQYRIRKGNKGYIVEWSHR
jgi:hypothetical protein